MLSVILGDRVVFTAYVATLAICGVVMMAGHWKVDRVAMIEEALETREGEEVAARLAEAERWEKWYAHYLLWLSAFLGGAVLFCQCLSAARESSAPAASPPEGFRAFQVRFIAIYLLMVTADWLQAPTAFSLHAYYGFTHSENSKLFLAGYISSMVLGLPAGALSDYCGRRLVCLVYCIAYAVSCATRHSRDFGVLLFGRVLAGMCTSILWTTFEAWMVSEHSARGFPSSLLDSTFSVMGTGNGVAAVLGSILAQAAVWAYNSHPVAPSDLSIVLLLVGGVAIAAGWGENVGSDRSSPEASSSLCQGDIPLVLLVGLTQCLYEGAMWVFVFLWTPALDPHDVGIPHGLVFASFMLCLSAGGAVVGWVSARGIATEGLLLVVYLVTTALFALPSFSKAPEVLMPAFCLYELCIGAYWPSIGILRSKVLPESSRTTWVNIFRVPLNAIVCGVLLHVGSTSTSRLFATCAALTLLCTGSHLALLLRLRASEVATT